MSAALSNTDEWVEIGSEGQIEAYTVTPTDIGAGPEAPLALAYVQLDGVDTSMVNVLEGVDLSDPGAAAASLSVGDRVQAVSHPADEREGRITDFHYELQDDTPNGPDP